MAWSLRHDIGYAWARVTDATSEPVDVDDVKAQAHITHDEENVLIQGYVTTARQYAEAYLERGLLTQTWQYTLDEWIDEIHLPMAAPLQSITHVKYYDEAGVLTTLASSGYLVDTISQPGRVLLAPNTSWPAIQSGRLSRVVITYVVGWTSSTLIPATITQGILMLAAYWCVNREAAAVGIGEGAALPFGIEALWGAHRVFHIPPVAV